MLFFKRKIERAYLKRRDEGKKELSQLSREEFEAEVREYKEKVELEKGDLPALFIGAFLAFWPILLFFLVIMVLMLIFW
ncbi:MAG TPA: hypothetical protein GX733_01025 [Tissierellia bacterium]|jgi:hypothetical protein|nr:hypothetical protein [Tissierellia bacterium]